MTARVQHIWDGAQPAYAALVDDRVQAPALDEFVAAIQAHLADRGTAGSGEGTLPYQAVCCQPSLRCASWSA